MDNLKLIKDANEIIRSFCSVIKRKGKDTNWDALEDKVKIILKEQHNYNNAEIIRLQNIGIAMANDLEQKRKEIESLKDQLAISSEQVPKGAYVINNLKK